MSWASFDPRVPKWAGWALGTGLVLGAVVTCQPLLDLGRYEHVPAKADSGTPGDQTTNNLLGDGENCEGNAARCSDLVPEICSEGRWVAQPPCGLSCAGGRCGECSAGTRCRNGAVETCVSGSWEFSDKCPLACEAGACVEACSEGRAQCNGDTLQRCNVGEYTDELDCLVACLSNAAGDQCGGDCRRQETRCVADAEGNPTNEAQVCTEDAIWGTASNCGTAFCVAGVCKPCQPGTRRCGVDGPESCSPDGEWAPERPCPTEQPVCLAGGCVVCSPGTRRCADNTLEVCSDNGGGWALEKVCGDETPACIEGLGDCGRCALGERQCSNDTVQVCDATGVHVDEDTCTDDTPDCVGGACRACDPAAPVEARCATGTSRQTCDAEGSWGPITGCSGADAPLCRADLGSRCGCEENTRRCASDGTPERCVAGEWVRQARCGPDTPVCLPASGQCVPCQPGAENCRNGILERCDSAGVPQNTGVCGSGQANCGNCGIGDPCNEDANCRSGVCLNGACAVCRPGSAECVGTTSVQTCTSDGRFQTTPCGPGLECRGDACVTVPCDADGAHTCVGSAPAGWSGPMAIATGPVGPAAPSCSVTTGYDRQVLSLSGDLEASGASCGCNCSTPAAMSCASTVSVFRIGDVGSLFSCSGIAVFDTPVVTLPRGTCRELSGSGRYAAQRPAFSAGACTAQPTSNITEASFAERMVACEASSVTTQGCSGGQVCLPDLAGPLESLCVFRAGDQACPASPFTSRSVFFSGFNDTRSCSTCSCGASSGSCGGTTTFQRFTGALTAGCAGGGGPGGGGVAPTLLAQPAYGACATITDALPFGVFTNPVPQGSCLPSGGALQGSVTTSGAVTVCCLP